MDWVNFVRARSRMVQNRLLAVNEILLEQKKAEAAETTAAAHRSHVHSGPSSGPVDTGTLYIHAGLSAQVCAMYEEL